MSDNRLTYDGLNEFVADLIQLPKELSGEGGDIVISRATEAGDDIRAEYAASAVTGNLAEHVKVTVKEKNEFGAIAEVKSTARHAYIYENGTQIRKTKDGKNLGAMPPANIFVPTVIRKRRAMVDDLKDLMRDKGLEVSG